MTNRLIYALLLLPLQMLLAQPHPAPELSIRAIGMNRYLNEGWGGPAPKYEVRFKEAIPAPELPKAEKIPYVELLMSGVQSLLLESKNYPHSESVTVPYGVFALGNFSKYYGNERLLQYANDIFLPDQGLLQKLYAWILPFYRAAFQKLSYDEQRKLLSRIDLCEAHLTYVVDLQRSDLYYRWLEGHGYQDDEKARGFLQRRLDKGQWTRKDCEYWLQTLRRDFEPLLKNPQIPASHYLVMGQLSKTLLIVVNGKGDFYLTDEHYSKKHEHAYRLLLNACPDDPSCEYVIAVDTGSFPKTRHMNIYTGRFLEELEEEW